MLRNAIRDNPQCEIIVCERSLEADCNVFAKMLFDDNMIEDINYKIYLQLYEACKKEFTVDGIIYIDADAAVCHKRVMTRARDGEEGVSLEYLTKCKKYHDEWLKGSECRMLHINANDDVCYDFENPEDKGIQWIKWIKGFIDNIANVYSGNVVVYGNTVIKANIYNGKFLIDGKVYSAEDLPSNLKRI
jgi:deoxyadenosine/deoxycytidine kinase